jgi:ABC-2 type transport system permease protein
MRVKALALRILKQMRHDKRTLALMFFAPLMIMTLVYFLLGSATTTIHVAVINGSEDYVEALYQNNVIVVRYDEGRAREALETGEVTATVNMVSGKSYIEVDGSNSAKAKMTLNTLESAKQYGMNQRADLKSEVHYIYGYEDLSDFDNFGSVLIGILIFFFVFLIAGISFLQERTSGTLEKLLSTPIRRWEVVAGYTLGYGTLTVIQSVIVSLYVVYGLDVMMVGSLWLILLITLLTAISALTLGTLLSTAANNEFQMMQFIPIVIVPQIFLSGLFELSPAWDAVGHITPLYYVADALNEVMIRGNGLPVIWLDLVVVALYCVLFMALNTVVLKRLRRI